MNHYPIPRDYPEYQSPPKKVSDGRRFSIYAALDAVFIVVALGLALWLAYILLVGSFVWSVKLVIPLTFGWATLAYLALPRLHQLFTLLYVPNYFIGRTKTVDGILGDPVNLAFDGTETDVHAAMRNAGWVPADPITLRSSWNIIISSVFGTSYPRAPVSDLYLFDTKQDFAYQQEVSGNASQRHHVRFWRVPEGWVLPGGYRADWLAAGTYDRSVGFSSFTFQFTHKVDADTDLERDYIVKTLRFSDHDIGVEVIRDFSTAYHQRNGGGDKINTDGNLPIIDVRDAAHRTPIPAPKKPPRKRRDPADHGVPPVSLLVAGGLLVLNIVGAIQLGIVALTGQDWGWLLIDDGADEPWWILLLMPFMSLIEIFLLVGTLLRHKWARIGLMMLCVISAVQTLVALTGETTSFRAVLFAFLSVFVVLGVSGDKVREWVSAEHTTLRTKQRA